MIENDSAQQAEHCPICREKLTHSVVFYWIISPPIASLLLVKWTRYYVEMACCHSCYNKIHHSWYLAIWLSILLPMGMVAGGFVANQLLGDTNEVAFFLFLVSAAYAIWFAAFNLTGLNKVHVTNRNLIEKGKQISRTHFRNSTPWFLSSLSPWGADRIDLEEGEESAKPLK